MPRQSLEVALAREEPLVIDERTRRTVTVRAHDPPQRLAAHAVAHKVAELCLEGVGRASLAKQ